MSRLSPPPPHDPQDQPCAHQTMPESGISTPVKSEPDDVLASPKMKSSPSSNDKVESAPLSQIEKEEYDKRMQSVIPLLHKVNGEWNRKAREFTLAVAKSGLNAMTKGSSTEKTLQIVIDKGNVKCSKMYEVEVMHATGQQVSVSRIQELKANSDDVYELIKTGNKLKLTLWGLLLRRRCAKLIDMYAEEMYVSSTCMLRIDICIYTYTHM